MTKIVNTHHFTIPAFGELGVDDRAHMLAVLTQDNIGQLAVYLGAWGNPPKWNAPEYEERRNACACWVASCGEKQSYTKALQYFPGLDENDYRA